MILADLLGVVLIHSSHTSQTNVICLKGGEMLLFCSDELSLKVSHPMNWLNASTLQLMC